MGRGDLVTRLKRTAQLAATMHRRWALHEQRCPDCRPGRPGCEEGCKRLAYVLGLEMALAMMRGTREWKAVDREP